MHNDNNHGIKLVQHSNSSSSNQLNRPWQLRRLWHVKRGGPGVSCLSLQFTAAAQGMARAEEAAAQVVSVRQQQRARALVGWAVFPKLKLGVLYNMHRRFSPRLKTGLGDKGQFGLICVFVVTSRFCWSYISNMALNREGLKMGNMGTPLLYRILFSSQKKIFLG